MARRLARRIAAASCLPAVLLLAACGADPQPAADPSAGPAAGAAPAAPPSPAPGSPPQAPAPSPAPVDPAALQMTQMARLGGGLHASAELCGLATDAAAHAAARERQREAAVGGGTLSAEAFDQAFDAGQAEARGAFLRASAADREAACGDMRALQQAAPKG